MARSLSRLILALLLTTALAQTLHAGPQYFDVHIHYSQNVWDSLSPQAALDKLRAAGITRALVSSTGDTGTRRLYRAAPEMILPALRPYRQRGERSRWMHDESVIPYLAQKLAEHPYIAIGEFHLQGREADLPVVRKMVQLARENNLILHAHVDAGAIHRLYAHDPDARILWAHAGFENAATVRELMETYPGLWADLSFRRDIYPASRFLPDWEALLVKHADRFMLGVDTYRPERWERIEATLAWYERMFSALPNSVAENIRYQNAARLIGRAFENRAANP